MIYCCSFFLFVHLSSILFTDIIFAYLGYNSNRLIQPLSTSLSNGCAEASVGNHVVVLLLQWDIWIHLAITLKYFQHANRPSESYTLGVVQTLIKMFCLTNFIGFNSLLNSARWAFHLEFISLLPAPKTYREHQVYWVVTLDLISCNYFCQRIQSSKAVVQSLKTVASYILSIFIVDFS